MVKDSSGGGVHHLWIGSKLQRLNSSTGNGGNTHMGSLGDLSSEGSEAYVVNTDKVTGTCGSVSVRMVHAPRGDGIVVARVPKKVFWFAGMMIFSLLQGVLPKLLETSSRFGTS